MRTLLLVFVIGAAAFPQAGNYRITDAREVVSERYGYAFRLPDRWYISASNPTPYFFTFSPELLGTFNYGVPAGSADMAVVKDSHEVGSIDRWMDLDRVAHHNFSSTRNLPLPPHTRITRAVQAVWFEDDGDANHKIITRTTAVYFELRKQVFAIFLRYNANDPNGGKYETTLKGVLESFRPLDGPGGTRRDPGTLPFS